MLFRLYNILVFPLLMLYAGFAEPTPDAVEDYFYTNNKIYYFTQEGTVSFSSNAPLENISAVSKKLRGAVDTSQMVFAFSVEITSFLGFNSTLQREHFNENYLDSEKFPKASFIGRIIEAIPFDKPGEYQIRAKGNLNIHGIKNERIISCKIIVSEHSITVMSEFKVLLADHNIKVPRIVNEKIAPEVNIKVNAELFPLEK